ncbi:hypothetical protein GCM10009727_84670 [Actinomadura napierensis]|uniref:Uncharacterized protein n=1 Tax=Actinomadura napierensis TaxID=267854 RepID=A0ABN3AG64_9ACTN
MLALRDAPAVLRVRGELVALQHDDLIEMPGEHARGAQPRHAPAEHHGRLPSHPLASIHTFDE